MLSKKGRQGLGAMKAICPTEPQTGTSVPHRLAALARACNSAMAALCSCRGLESKRGLQRHDDEVHTSVVDVGYLKPWQLVRLPLR